MSDPHPPYPPPYDPANPSPAAQYFQQITGEDPAKYFGGLTEEELAKAYLPYDGPTYTIEEVLAHAREKFAQFHQNRRAA